jgi:hypothetical protein
MARFRKNESIASKRNLDTFVYQLDGVTPALAATNWAAAKAICPLIGTHAATVRVVAPGVAGNTYSFTTKADGSGSGSLTHSGHDYVYHYQSGVTAMHNVVDVLFADGTLELVGGTYTAGDTLAATGDTQGPLLFTGGLDLAFKVRGNDGSGSEGVVYADAAGTFTNTTLASIGVDGEWIYQFTQAELNFVGANVGVMVVRPSQVAQCLLQGTQPGRLQVVVAGTSGNVYTFSTVAGGSGSGSLTKSGNDFTFHYQTTVTTMANLASALAADGTLTLVGGSYTGSNTLASTGDTQGPLAFAGGFDGFRTAIFVSEMNDAADFDAVDENGHTYGDTHRLQTATLANVDSGYDTGTIPFKSMDGAKTRLTGTTAATGRLTSTVGDLTP